MRKKYYILHFECRVSPSKHWGEPCEDGLTFDATEYFEDGQEFELWDSEFEKEVNIKISQATDCVEVIDLKYRSDEINASDYIEESENPHNNGCDDEFEDGYGDEELESFKVEVFDDADRENLIDTVNV